MNDKLFSMRDTCRLCESNSLALGIPLRPIPVASPNIDVCSIEKKNLHQVTAPLDVYRCNSCGLMQLTTVMDRNFQYDTFMYETSISLGLTEHFAELAEILSTEQTRSSFSVLEIGSNDGTLLEFFKKKGSKVLGIDPAKRIAETATARGIPTFSDFFTKKLAEQIVAEHGKMDIIICNNTLANIDDLTEITEGVRACLASDGLFVVETQYSLDVLEKMLLDVIYHEHLSYFSVKPLVKFFAKKGFDVVKVERIWPKGGSIRVYIQLMGGGRLVDASVGKLIELEESSGLYKQALYQCFNDRLHRISEQIKTAVSQENELGNKVAIYGSSVGCVSLLNQFDLGRYISFIVDDNPFKNELIGIDYTIEVVSREELVIRNPSLVIVLAWRYAESIQKKNMEYLLKGGKLLIPLPEVSFVSVSNENNLHIREMNEIH